MSKVRDLVDLQLKNFAKVGDYIEDAYRLSRKGNVLFAKDSRSGYVFVCSDKVLIEKNAFGYLSQRFFEYCGINDTTFLIIEAEFLILPFATLLDSPAHALELARVMLVLPEDDVYFLETQPSDEVALNEMRVPEETLREINVDASDMQTVKNKDVPIEHLHGFVWVGSDEQPLGEELCMKADTAISVGIRLAQAGLELKQAQEA